MPEIAEICGMGWFGGWLIRINNEIDEINQRNLIEFRNLH